MKSENFNTIEINKLLIPDLKKLIGETPEYGDNLKDSVNYILKIMLELIRDPRVKTILKKDENQSYFQNMEVEVIRKITDFGLAYWDDPIKGKEKLFEEFNQIPENIKNEWRNQDGFFQEAELYNNKQKYLEISERFYQNFIESNFKNIMYQKILDYINDTKNYTLIQNEIQSKTINSNINRLLPVKFFTYFLIYLINLDIDKNTTLKFKGIEISEFYNKSKIATKVFVKNIIEKDIILHSEKNTKSRKKITVPRESRRITSFPMASELYQDFRKVENDDFNREFDTSFSRFFHYFMGIDGKDFTIKSNGLIRELGLVDFKKISLKSNLKDTVCIIPTITALELMKKADNFNNMSFFSFDESKEVFNLIYKNFFDEAEIAYKLIKQIQDIENTVQTKVQSIEQESLDKRRKKIKAQNSQQESIIKEILDRIMEEQKIKNFEKELNLKRIAVLGRLQDIGFIKWVPVKGVNKYQTNPQAIKYLEKKFLNYNL